MPQAGVSRREAWLDALRGFACLLVVYNHAAGFSPVFGVPIDGFWFHAIRMFDAFRMPVFFFVAGLLAATVVSRTWTELVRHRVVGLIWVYLLWAVLQAVVPELVQMHVAPGDWQQVAWALVWPHQNLWFLWALALYLLVATGIRRLPVQLQLALGIALTVAVQFGAIGASDNPAVAKVAQYFVYFIVAVHIRRPVLAMSRPRVPVVIAWTAGFVLAAELWIRSGGVLGPLFPLATSVLAILAGLTVARAVGDSALLRPLRYLGRRTLPIYCVHFLPAILLPLTLHDAIDGSSLHAIWPIVATGAALVVALITYESTRRVTWLWQAPAWLERPWQSPSRSRVVSASPRQSVALRPPAAGPSVPSS